MIKRKLKLGSITTWNRGIVKQNTTVWNPTVIAICLTVTLCALASERAICAVATPTGASVAGQLHALTIDPADGTIYAGGDVCGVYRSTDGGATWEMWNQGLESTNRTMSFYVDELMVVPDGSAALSQYWGVYAATLGGIYHRKQTDLEWTLLTDYEVNSDYQYFRNRAQSRGYPIPFCALVYDDIHGRIYAGAGNGRWKSNRHDYRNMTYPGLEPAEFRPPFSGGGSIDGQYPVWALDVSVGSSTFLPDRSLATASPTGIARQLALFNLGRNLAVATSTGLFVADLDSLGGCAWTSSEVGFNKSFGGHQWSGWVWGVAGGANGVLYALLESGDVPGAPGPSPMAPGVFYKDFAGSGVWQFLDNPARNVLPHDRSFGRPDKLWSGFIADAAAGSFDLKTITVLPGATVAEDQVFVGARSGTMNSGYFRYGPYFVSQGSVDSGWLHVHLLEGRWNGFTYGYLDWKANPVDASALHTITPAASDEMGWLSNNASFSTVPMEFNPANLNEIVADLYGVPMRSTNGGRSWSQIYCNGSSGTGWSTRGMSLATVNAFDFREDGRMLIANGDFGVFESLVNAPDSFKWLNWYGRFKYSFLDICVLKNNGVEEIYAIDDGLIFLPGGSEVPRQNAIMQLNTSSFHSMNDWLRVTPLNLLRANFSDIEVYDQNTIFAAASSDTLGRARLYKGVRSTAPGGGIDQWSPVFDLSIRPNLPVDKRINTIKRIPGTSLMLYGGERGVYCFDAENLQNDPVPWLVQSSPGFAGLAAGHVNTIEVDRFGTTVYVGTRGASWSTGDSAEGSNVTGTVVRFDGPFSVTAGVIPQPTPVFLANEGNDFPFGFTPVHFVVPIQDDGRPNQRYTSIRSIAIDPNNPYRFFAAMFVEDSEYGGSMHVNNGVWRCDGTLGADTRWTQVYGGLETRGANRPVKVLKMNPAGLESLDDGVGELLIGTNGQGPFRLPVSISPRPLISQTAQYPILAGSTDATTVIAVSITDPSGTGIVEVTMDASSIAGPGSTSVALLDDGQGEDSKMGDGIFTSSRLPATIPVDSTSVKVDVFAHAVDHGYSRQQVTVDVVFNNAKFVDIADSTTGDLYKKSVADPYSAVYFGMGTPGTAADTLKAIVVTFDDGVTTPLLAKQMNVSRGGVPFFKDQLSEWLNNTPLPAGSRGVSYADIDNDGDQDLFVCQNGADSRLLINRVNESGGFVDETLSFFGANKAILNGVHVASWGDYNRDGYIDLFVSTMTYDQPVKSIANVPIPGYEILIFRNNGGGGFELTPFGAPGFSDGCLSGVWVDLDSDGDLDLVAAMYITGLRVFENLGYIPSYGDDLLVPNTSAGTVDQPIIGATSVSVIDYDHNDYPDLVLTLDVLNASRAVILQNNMRSNNQGSPGFTVVDTLGAGTAHSDAVVADFDLNGQEDIVLLSKTGVPSMFMGSGTGVRDAVPTYADLGYTLGLRAGSVPGAVTGGGFAADFNGDHDYDLYLGRIKGDPFLYKNVRQDSGPAFDPPALTQKWLQVNLSTLGNSNASLIGTKVTVTGGGQQWTRTVDGGSGRGGQRTNQLIFGLGNLSQATVDVQVRFPSGDMPIATNVPVNTEFNAAEEALIEMAPDSRVSPNPVFSYELVPSGADWLFSWKTNIKGDLRQDKVLIENFNGYTSRDPCYIGVLTTQGLDLTWGLPNVEMTVYWDGAWWQHVVRWRNRPCVSNAGCIHRFSVTSGLQSGAAVTSGNQRTNMVDFCIPDVQINWQ